MTNLKGRTLFYKDTGQYSEVLVVSDTSDAEAHRMRLRVTKRIQDGPTIWKEGDEFDIMQKKNMGGWCGGWKLLDGDGNDMVTFDSRVEDQRRSTMEKSMNEKLKESFAEYRKNSSICVVGEDAKAVAETEEAHETIAMRALASFVTHIVAEMPKKDKS